MTHSPAEVLRATLIAKGLTSDPTHVPLQAWPAYAGGEPTSPDQIVTVYGTVGADHGREMVTGEVLGNYGFQIRLRSNDYAGGRDKMETIVDTLAQDLYNLQVNIGTEAYLVQAVVRFGDILELGKEVPNSKRSLFTFNAQIVYRQLT